MGFDQASSSCSVFLPNTNAASVFILVQSESLSWDEISHMKIWEAVYCWAQLCMGNAVSSSKPYAILQKYSNTLNVSDIILFKC